MPEYDLQAQQTVPQLLTNKLHSDKLNGSTVVPMDAEGIAVDEYSSHCMFLKILT